MAASNPHDSLIEQARYLTRVLEQSGLLEVAQQISERHQEKISSALGNQELELAQSWAAMDFDPADVISNEARRRLLSGGFDAPAALTAAMQPQLPAIESQIRVLQDTISRSVVRDLWPGIDAITRETERQSALWSKLVTPSKTVQDMARISDQLDLHLQALGVADAQRLARSAQRIFDSMKPDVAPALESIEALRLDGALTPGAAFQRFSVNLAEGVLRRYGLPTDPPVVAPSAPPEAAPVPPPTVLIESAKYVVTSPLGDVVVGLLDGPAEYVVLVVIMWSVVTVGGRALSAWTAPEDADRL